jgi:hypothetical protein
VYAIAKARVSEVPEVPQVPEGSLHFLVGRDRSNHWVVLETHGLAGGLFSDEASALRFARDESQGRAAAVEIAADRLDFSITGH